MNKENLILCISLLLVTIFSDAQRPVQISVAGTIKGIEIEKGSVSIIPISLGLDCMAYKFDSITVSVVNNQFHFSGFMPYPHGFEALTVNSIKTNFATSSFFLDAGNITITCFYDSVKQVTPDIRYSKTNDEYQDKFLPEYKPVQDLLDSFLNRRSNEMEKYNGVVPESEQKEILMLRNKYAKKRNAFLRKYIKQNPKSFIPLAMLGQSTERMSYDIIDIEKTFAVLSPAMKNTISGIKIKEAFSIKKLGPLSDSLKTLAFFDEKSNKTKIETKSNKYTLIDFWFSACKPCIAQFPELISLYQTYGAKGFEIISISTDKNRNDWTGAISKYKISWKHLWDKENLTSNKLTIYSYPTNFLIDNKGQIINRNIELNELKRFLSNELR